MPFKVAVPRKGAAGEEIDRDKQSDSCGQARGQHLLRHTLPSKDMELHFSSSRKKDIVKEVKSMKQKDLQVRDSALLRHACLSWHRVSGTRNLLVKRLIAC